MFQAGREKAIIPRHTVRSKDDYVDSSSSALQDKKLLSRNCGKETRERKNEDHRKYLPVVLWLITQSEATSRWQSRDVTVWGFSFISFYEGYRKFVNEHPYGQMMNEALQQRWKSCPRFTIAFFFTRPKKNLVYQSVSGLIIDLSRLS